MGDHSLGISSRGLEAVVPACIFTAIAFLIVSLRFFTRLTIVKSFGVEDSLIGAALLASILYTALLFLETTYGLGRHMATLPAENVTPLLKIFYASVPFYQTSLVLTKISILHQYRRIFHGKQVRRLINALGVICITYALWSILSNIFICTPIAYFWNPTIPGGHCLDKQAVWFTNTALNIATDIAIFVLPMPILKQLQLPRRQRIALIGVFGLGGFVCLVSVIRFKPLYVISVSHDPAWDNVAAGVWSSIEANVAIISASLPALKALLVRFFPRLLRNSTQAPTLEQTAFSTRFGGLKATAPQSSDRTDSKIKSLRIELREWRSHDELVEAEDGNIRVVKVLEQVSDDLQDIDRESWDREQQAYISGSHTHHQSHV